MGIKKLTELESVTPESGEDASVYGEVGGKVVKLPYGQTDETAIKEAVTDYLEENDIAAGNGIASVTQIESSKASSGTNIWRVTMTDGTYYDLTIYNGEQGTAEADPLEGKTVVCFGDSLMTGGDSTASDSNGFARIIKNRHPGANVYNYGKGGSVLSKNAYTLSNNNGESRAIVLETMYTAINDTATYPGAANPDYVVFDGAGNDLYCLQKYGYSYFNNVVGTADLSTAGEISSYDTMYNALDYTLSAVIAQFPSAKVMFISSAYTSYDTEISLAVQRQISNNIAGICAKYGATFYDLGQTALGFRKYIRPYTTEDSLFKDNLHMSEEGYDFIADSFEAALVEENSNQKYAPDTFDVTLSGSISSASKTAFTADHTYDEVLNAYNAGKTVRVIDGQGIVMTLASVNSSGVYMFSSIVDSNNTYLAFFCYNYVGAGSTMYGRVVTLNSGDDTSGDSSGGTFDVTISGTISSTSMTTFTADHSYSEIAAAHAAGKMVRVIDGQGIVMTLASVDSSGTYMFSTTASTGAGGTFYAFYCYSGAGSDTSNTNIYGWVKVLS